MNQNCQISGVNTTSAILETLTRRSSFRYHRMIWALVKTMCLLWRPSEFVGKCIKKCIVLGFVRKIWLDLTATTYTVYTEELWRLGRICEDIEGGLGGQRPWPRLGGQQQPLIWQLPSHQSFSRSISCRAWQKWHYAYILPPTHGTIENMSQKRKHYCFLCLCLTL